MRRAPEVSTSSGKDGFPAEAQCTQLLSQANVHRQGTIYKGPFSFSFIFFMIRVGLGNILWLDNQRTSWTGTAGRVHNQHHKVSLYFRGQPNVLLLEGKEKKRRRLWGRILIVVFLHDFSESTSRLMCFSFILMYYFIHVCCVMP
jgi:hypothetical protein